MAEAGTESSRLVRLCLEAACESLESVERWRMQRRTLESMPAPLADALLRKLLLRRLLFPSLLEVFKHSVEVIDLKGENSVDAEWMAYIGAFRFLHSLNLADCHRINSSSLWELAGMTCLKELDVSRCAKVNDAGVRNLLSISTLEVLRIPETGVTANGVALLSPLRNLSALDLGGLPVTDKSLNALQVLTKLEYLELWGSKVSNKGVIVLQKFPKLSFLGLAWTSVTRLPNMPSLECLNLSNCTIDSLLQGDGNKALLTKLSFYGSTFANETEAFSCMETSFLSSLDVSNSSLQRFNFLHHMRALEHLDLGMTMFGDDSAKIVAHIGANLRTLNLSKTRITSAGVSILAGHVPKLEDLSLSHTSIDDMAIPYLSLMPSLKIIDLCNTNITGLTHEEGAEPNLIPTFTALHSLDGLERLNLEHVKVGDAALDPLSSFQNLSHLFLRSASLTDISLHNLSSLPKLTSLGICDAVLTNQGLDTFRPHKSLRVLDLRGCWLLTKDALTSFCAKHSLIEIRHELIGATLLDQSSSYRSSPSRSYLRTSQLNRKREKASMSWPLSQRFIVDGRLDQRLKYTREELLALQFQSSSLDSDHDIDLVMLKDLSG
ncbi:hypothetical protein Tsubulata_005810 [Turnera subulata]|uniref:Uncharacterized protein n=1 Tax=Turnera subulata TaxID=218843 RepID=A0A9Q0GFW0_9ROSI|nr:hypothetical protein Tsubulata_005810 [Turnera subulata]